MSGRYPSSFYRVSVKALIRNEKGEVLVVREAGDDWSLPGGGIDHGEDITVALARELYEEALITAPFECKLLGTETLFLEKHDTWLMWIIYEVTPEAGFSYSKGEDAEEVAFKDPMIFKDNHSDFARWVHKWGMGAVDR